MENCLLVQKSLREIFSPCAILYVHANLTATRLIISLSIKNINLINIVKNKLIQKLKKNTC